MRVKNDWLDDTEQQKGVGIEMNYISVLQAAEKWGITKRRVQEYCLKGRIDGAVKVGSVWTVPEQAEKPLDPRKNEDESCLFDKYYEMHRDAKTLFPGTMVLDEFRFGKKTIEQMAEEIEDPVLRICFLAEVEVLKGNYKKALRHINKVPKTGTFAVTGLHLRWICNGVLHDHQSAKECYIEMEQLKQQYKNDEKSTQIVEILWSIWNLSLFENSNTPEYIKQGELSKIYPEFRISASYAYTRYLHNNRSYSFLAGFCEGTSSYMTDGTFLMNDLIYGIFRAIGYVGTGEFEKSREILYDIYTSALKYDFTAIFIQYLVFFGGQMEIMLKQYYPKHRRLLADRWKMFFVVLDTAKGKNIKKTSSYYEPILRELEVLMLVQQGFRHKTIADIMQLNVNTISSLAQKARTKVKKNDYQNIIVLDNWFR